MSGMVKSEGEDAAERIWSVYGSREPEDWCLF